MRTINVTRTKVPSVVGLEIGSDSVRAAELARTRQGLSLRHWGQVEVPTGAVVDGEIVQPGVVATALRRLWSDVDFSTRNVVVAVSGQRVIVRHAEVPQMSEGDFRQALRYQAAELIPIPVDNAVMDFVITAPASGSVPNTMAILLAAAHKDVVGGLVAVLRDASLRPVALDPAAMAAVRASRWGGIAGVGTVAIVDIGTQITVITIRQDGRARFSRILDSGGSNLTTQLAGRLTVVHNSAETLTGARDSVGANGATDTRVSRLVTEIEGSLSFFASQLVGSDIEQILVTGDQARSGLIGELNRRLSAPVAVLDALAGLDLGSLELSPADRESASLNALLALGAAEWVFDVPSERLSLLPGEVAKAAALKRKVVLAGATAAALVLGLGALSVHKSDQVSREKALLVVAKERSSGLQSELVPLKSLSAVRAPIQARVALTEAADTDNVAWPALLSEIAAAMPTGTQLTSCAFSGDAAAAGSTPTTFTTPAGAGTVIGTVTMSVTGQGSEEVVAAWLRAMTGVKGLSEVTVPSAAIGRGTITFAATASVTSSAPMVQRPDLTSGAGT
jgi:type IV pilus assembly protein PilM